MHVKRRLQCRLKCTHSARKSDADVSHSHALAQLPDGAAQLSCEIDARMRIAICHPRFSFSLANLDSRDCRSNRSCCAGLPCCTSRPAWAMPTPKQQPAPRRAKALRALWRKALTANSQHGRGWTPLCWPRRLGPACPIALPSVGMPSAYLPARSLCSLAQPAARLAALAPLLCRASRAAASFASLSRRLRPTGATRLWASGRLRLPSGLGLACGSTALNAHPESRGASAPAVRLRRVRDLTLACGSGSPAGGKPPAKVVGAGAPTARRATLARGPVGRPAAPPTFGLPRWGGESPQGLRQDAAPAACFALPHARAATFATALRACSLPCGVVPIPPLPPVPLRGWRTALFDPAALVSLRADCALRLRVATRLSGFALTSLCEVSAFPLAPQTDRRPYPSGTAGLLASVALSGGLWIMWKAFAFGSPTSRRDRVRFPDAARYACQIPGVKPLRGLTPQGRPTERHQQEGAGVVRIQAIHLGGLMRAPGGLRVASDRAPQAGLFPAGAIPAASAPLALRTPFALREAIAWQSPRYAAVGLAGKACPDPATPMASRGEGAGSLPRLRRVSPRRGGETACLCPSFPVLLLRSRPSLLSRSRAAGLDRSLRSLHRATPGGSGLRLTVETPDQREKPRCPAP